MTNGWRKASIAASLLAGIIALSGIVYGAGKMAADVNDIDTNLDEKEKMLLSVMKEQASQASEIKGLKHEVKLLRETMDKRFEQLFESIGLKPVYTLPQSPKMQDVDTLEESDAR